MKLFKSLFRGRKMPEIRSRAMERHARSMPGEAGAIAANRYGMLV